MADNSVTISLNLDISGFQSSLASIKKDMEGITSSGGKTGGLRTTWLNKQDINDMERMTKQIDSAVKLGNKFEMKNLNKDVKAAEQMMKEMTEMNLAAHAKEFKIEDVDFGSAAEGVSAATGGGGGGAGKTAVGIERIVSALTSMIRGNMSSFNVMAVIQGIMEAGLVALGAVAAGVMLLTVLIGGMMLFFKPIATMLTAIGKVLGATLMPIAIIIVQLLKPLIWLLIPFIRIFKMLLAPLRVLIGALIAFIAQNINVLIPLTAAAILAFLFPEIIPAAAVLGALFLTLTDSAVLGAIFGSGVMLTAADILGAVFVALTASAIISAVFVFLGIDAILNWLFPNNIGSNLIIAALFGAAVLLSSTGVLDAIFGAGIVVTLSDVLMALFGTLVALVTAPEVLAALFIGISAALVLSWLFPDQLSAQKILDYLFGKKTEETAGTVAAASDVPGLGGQSWFTGVAGGLSSLIQTARSAIFGSPPSPSFAPISTAKAYIPGTEGGDPFKDVNKSLKATSDTTDTLQSTLSGRLNPFLEIANTNTSNLGTCTATLNPLLATTNTTIGGTGGLTSSITSLMIACDNATTSLSSDCAKLREYQTEQGLYPTGGTEPFMTTSEAQSIAMGLTHLGTPRGTPAHDFVMSPGGQLVKTDPMDYIMGMTKSSMGGKAGSAPISNITINVNGNVDDKMAKFITSSIQREIATQWRSVSRS